MKSSLLTKAALCICPPVVVAGTVAGVPPVRHAVHRLTSPARPHGAAPHAVVPCVPLAHRTLASPLPPLAEAAPDEPVAYTALTPTPGAQPVGPAPLNPPSFPGGPGLLPPGTATNPTPPPAVPEPAAWMTMVLGFGLVGGALRLAQLRRVRARAALAGGGAAVAAGGGLSALLGGGALSTAAMLSVGATPVRAGTRLAQLGSKLASTPLLAKAALCVCPPLAMVAGTAALPPVRHAVYNATAPHLPVAALHPAIAGGTQPCVPVDVPTAAQAVEHGGDELAVFRPTPAWPS